MAYMRTKRHRRLDAGDPLADMIGGQVLAWYDASTLTEANGAAVDRLVDLSGNGMDVLATNSPTAVTDALGGLTVINLGANGYLANTSFGNEWPQPTAIAQPFVQICLARANPGLIGSDRIYIGGSGAGGSAGTPSLMLNSTNGTPQLATLSSRSNGGGGPLNDDQWHIVAGVFDTASNSIYVDGYLVHLSTTQTHGAGTWAGIGIGAASTGSRPLQGYFAEGGAIAGRLTPAGIADITAYLATKWGLAA